MNSIRHPFLRVASGRFFWLLLSLVVFILFAGEVSNTTTGAWESFFSILFILMAVTFATRSGNGRRLVMVSLNAVMLASWAASFRYPNVVGIRLVLFAMFMASLFLAMFWTMEFVLGSGTVSLDHILGAICAYIMIAMIFATVYTVQFVLDRSSFNGLQPEVPRPWGELFYFSCTTLSTVGYGDIVPVTFRTRSVAIIEQLTGTFYVAILIARLAGLYAPQAAGQTGLPGQGSPPRDADQSKPADQAHR